ncbi:MAG: DUF2145 domain-containing protein, partial [Burkholderiales bacterium]
MFAITCGVRRGMVYVVALACLLVSGHADAGRSCEARRPSVVSVTRGLDLAERARSALDATGAKVVVIARSGQDLRKYRLRYSHLGFAVRGEDGRWLVSHKLNQCGSAVAHLYRQGLAEFFLDDLFRADAVFVVLRNDVQEALYPVLTSARVKALHIESYNVVAYPWSTRYQQSNQWAIETLAMAMSPRVRGREQAQAWLKFEGYIPTPLDIPP